VFIRTPAGTVLHTGDFKLDQTPIDGVHTDFAALSKWGAYGVDLMMSDSTNAMNATFTKSEAEVGKALYPIIANAKQRVIVASFSSHIHRLQQVCDVAVACNRKVVVTGRSMIQNTKIARDLGYLKIDERNIIDAFDMKDIPADKVVILCTGSQGEPLSALARMANGEHRTVSVEEGDTVVLSATPVPGNEKAVTRVVNGLAKIGADVYDKKRALVHVSGHAGAEELKIVLSIVQPRYFLPVHGEAMHLRAHAKLAEAVGISKDHIFVMDNGDSLTVESHKVRRSAPVETSGVVYVDGLSVGDTSTVVLRDRQLLSKDGIVTVVVIISAQKHRQVGGTEVVMRGVTGADDPDLNAEAQQRVTAAVLKATDNATACDTAVVSRQVRESLAKLLWDRCRRRPMIIPIVMEI
jgi:ribonuclease J